MDTTDAMIIMLIVTKKESTGRLPDSFLSTETNIFPYLIMGTPMLGQSKNENALTTTSAIKFTTKSVVSQIRINASQIEGCSNNILVSIDAFYNNDYDRVDIYRMDTGQIDKNKYFIKRNNNTSLF